MIRQVPLVLGFVAFGFACSSGSGSGTGGSGGDGATGGSGGSAAGGTPLAYKPCDLAARLGGFSVQLVRNEGSTPFTDVTGAVKGAVDPTAVWREMAKEGDCRMMIGPAPCSVACASGKVCGGASTCVDEPLTQDVGTVTVSGLGSPLTLMQLEPPAPPVYTLQKQDATALQSRYPPFAPEAEVGIKTSGGKYPAISLAGRGIEPLEFAGRGLKVAHNQPLPITWTASAKNRSARIHIKLDIAHHGGISARIECDVADTGSTTISAALINKLMDQGVAGLPGIALTRQTVDSTTVPGGCVDFTVASEEAREIEVEGVISCTTTDATCPPDEMGCKACPAGKTCGRDFQCK
jgi:hypothetical protein